MASQHTVVCLLKGCFADQCNICGIEIESFYMSAVSSHTVELYFSPSFLNEFVPLKSLIASKAHTV